METSHDNRVAVIGIAGRFPGAANVGELWEVLRRGDECLTRLTREELIEAGVRLEEIDDPAYVPVAGMIDKAADFDARLFGFSPKEAEYVDPQQRVFLETALEALENAGCNPFSYPGAIGVYAGAALSFYQMSVMMANYELLRGSDSLRTLFATGVANDYLATRVAYKLRLRGPAVTIQTACSTSLVAVHMACQSLMSGECDVALAGGVSIQASCFKGGYVYSEGGMTSPDGHCRPFDEEAGGTVFADGSACVVLKRLRDAMADGDNIRAIIRGTAINNDGSEKLGFAAPGIAGQAAVITEALAQGDVHPNEVGYVEAHGTATALGDPIELTALSQAFRAAGFSAEPCAVGSIKGNLGHLNHAAGATGLIKVVLALEQEAVPPSINFRRLNSNIPTENLAFRVATELRPWQRSSTPRIAGVNSFGIGGTNAHVIVEEAPVQPSTPSDRTWHLLPISGKTASARDANAAALKDWLKTHPGGTLADVAHTLGTGRIFHQHGAVALARSWDEAVQALETRSKDLFFSGSTVNAQDRSSAGRPVAFLYPGQGTQRPGMGTGLRAEEAVFDEALRKCFDLAERISPQLDLEGALAPRSNDEASLNETDVTQPALFATSYAMTRLWMARGVRPQFLLGHSIGELVAACVAGVFSLEDAMEVVIRRGQLMKAMPRGKMIAVPVDESEIAELIDDELSFAAFNAPGMCVVSGPDVAIERFEKRLASRNIYGTVLQTSHAFHSSMMKGAVSPFVEFLRTKRMQAPSIPIVSNLTGAILSAEMACDPKYWGQQLLGTVRFAEGLRTLEKEGVGVALEVGFGRTASGLAQQTFSPVSGITIISSVPTMRVDRDEAAQFSQAVARTWLAGAEMDWSEPYRDERRRKVPLPSYQFERSRYWAIENDAKLAFSHNDLRTRPSGMDDWTHVLSWRRQPGAITASDAADLATQSWLVFDDSSAFCREVVQKLRNRGATVRVVLPGADFQNEADQRFSIDPTSSAHVERLSKALVQATPRPTDLLYLWGVEGALPDQLERGPLDAGYVALLRLVQSLGGLWEANHNLRFCLVTADVQDILGTEQISVNGAAIFGLSLVVPLEHANFPCQYVDISSHDSASNPVLAAGRLVAALSATSESPVLGIRGPSAWLPYSRSIALPAASAVPDPLRASGVYLITGGLGDLGLAVAAHLAENHRAKLILVSRQQLPSEETWAAVAEAQETAPRQAATLRKLLQLKAFGSDLLVASSNVSDLESLRAAVAEGEKRFGKVDGVFHAAGLPGTGPIMLKTDAQIEGVFAAKVEGTRNLARIFEGKDLDFIVFFSTISSVIGGVAQCDYGAANAWLDALARKGMPECSRRVFAFNWDAWGELGMAVTTEVPEAVAIVWAAELKRIGLSTREGIEILLRGMRSPFSQLVVSKRLEIDSNGFQEGVLRVTKRLPRASDALVDESAPTGPRYPRPPMSVEYVAPRTELEAVLVRFWGDALNIEGIGVHDDFFELGGHSLLALQLIPRLRTYFGAAISSRELFGQAVGATIADLAPIIEAKLIEEISEELNEDDRAARGREDNTAPASSPA